MGIFKLSLKIIGQISFVIIFFSTLEAKNFDKFNAGDYVSDYFSGILLLNDNRYNESFRFLKKLNGLEESHINYSIKYLYSLVNSENFNEAFSYSKKLEKQKIDNYESNLIIGIFYLRNSNLELAKKYFSKAKNKSSRFILNNYVSSSLYNWSSLNKVDLSYASLELQKLDKRFENLKKIQSIFLNCYFNTSNTNKLFKELNSNEKTDFSRYNYFHASYFATSGKIEEAKKIVKSALKNNPRNLLLNQYKIDLNKKNCTLKNNATNMVFCDGNPKSGIMLVGEAPGSNEDQEGLPFVGRAGVLLDKMLASINLNRKNVYISNIINYRPPDNRRPTDEEMNRYLPFIKKHIEIINPKILILLGSTAMNALIGNDTVISEVRGQWIEKQFGQCKTSVIVTFHPAFLMRQPTQKKLAWVDLKMIRDKKAKLKV